MQKPFDIFWFGDSGPRWIEAVETLDIAKARIETFPHRESGSYQVLDQRTGKHFLFAPVSVDAETASDHAPYGTPAHASTGKDCEI